MYDIKTAHLPSVVGTHAMVHFEPSCGGMGTQNGRDQFLVCKFWSSVYGSIIHSIIKFHQRSLVTVKTFHFIVWRPSGRNVSFWFGIRERLWLTRCAGPHPSIG